MRLVLLVVFVVQWGTRPSIFCCFHLLVLRLMNFSISLHPGFSNNLYDVSHLLFACVLMAQAVTGDGLSLQYASSDLCADRTWAWKMLIVSNVFMIV